MKRSKTHDEREVRPVKMNGAMGNKCMGVCTLGNINRNHRTRQIKNLLLFKIKKEREKIIKGERDKEKE